MEMTDQNDIQENSLHLLSVLMTVPIEVNSSYNDWFDDDYNNL